MIITFGGSTASHLISTMNYLRNMTGVAIFVAALLAFLNVHWLSTTAIELKWYGVCYALSAIVACVIIVMILDVLQTLRSISDKIQDITLLNLSVDELEKEERRRSVDENSSSNSG